MPEDQHHTSLSAEDFGTVRKDAEGFGTVPKASEPFRTVRNDAESNVSQRKENHSLTVREAARMFEAAGVARTERSIVNWCQLNAQGMARLDAYFDPNERKYYITPQSVELAIAEEKAKAVKNPVSEPVVSKDAEDFRTIRKDSEDRNTRELENEIRDLQITNKAKDIVIERMQKERDGFFDQLLAANRKVGELEAKLLQLKPPDSGVN